MDLYDGGPIVVKADSSSARLGSGILMPIEFYGDIWDHVTDIEEIVDAGESSIVGAVLKNDGRRVILKEYYRGKVKTATDWEDMDKSFGREMNFLRRARQEGVMHVPRLVGYGKQGVKPVLVMERIEGRTLADVLAETGYIPDLKLIEEVAQSVAVPLAYAHEQLGGFVHRDVKPANIMISNMSDTSAREVTLLDWSTVRDLGDTMTNTQLCSIMYSAPEVLYGRKVTAAADVFSLGKTLEHCLLGEEFVRKEGVVCREDLVRRNISALTIDALMKATFADSTQRYQSVREFVETLRLNFANVSVVDLRRGISMDECVVPLDEIRGVRQEGLEKKLVEFDDSPLEYNPRFCFIGINRVKEVVSAQRGLVVINDSVGGVRHNQWGYLLAANFANKVGMSQWASIGLNMVDRINENQQVFLGINYGRVCGCDQLSVLGINYGDEIKGEQRSLLGINYVRRIGGSQRGVVVGLNLAQEVGEDQVGVFVMNYAHTVDSQYGLLNIATKELKGRQRGLINYADSEDVRQYGLLCMRPGKKQRWNLEFSLGRYLGRK